MKEKLENLSKKELIDKIKSLSKQIENSKKTKAETKDINAKNSAFFKQKNLDYYDIFNNSVQALYILDNKGSFIDVNKAAEKMYGYPRSHFRGKNAEFIAAPNRNDLQLVCHYVAEALKGNPQQFDFWGIRKNGEIFPKIISVHKINNIDIDAVVAYGIDITQRKKIELLLEKNEKYINTIFDNAPVGIGVEVNKKINKVNLNFSLMTGYSEKELIGKSLRKLFSSQKEYERISKGSNGNLFENSSSTFETKFLKKDGKTIDVKLTLSLIDKNNIDIGLLFSVVDISDLKYSAKQISDSEKKYRMLAENMQDVIWTIDLKGYVTYVSPSFKNVTEQMPNEILGQNIKNFVNPEDYLNIKKKIDIFQKTETEYPHWEIEYLRKNKNNIWIETNVSVLKDDNKKTIGFIGVSRNIDSRKNAEIALKESQKKYLELSRLLVSMADNIADLIWAKDKNGNFIFTNKSFSKNFLNAKNTKEPIGKNDMFFVMRERQSHPKNPFWHTFGELCVNSDAIVIKTKKAGRFDEFGNVKGKFLFLDVYKAPLFDESGKLIGTVGSARDVTKEKEYERKLIESEEKYRLLFENMNEGVFYQSSNGILTDANKSALKILGLKKSEFIKTNSFDKRWIVKDKNRNILPPEKHPSMLALKTGNKVLNYELYFQNNNTKQEKCLIVNAIPQFKNSEKDPYQVFVTIHDISEIKKAQQLILEEKEKFKLLFDNMKAGVAIYDVTKDNNNFILNDVNKAGLQANNAEKSSILNKKITSIFPEIKKSGLLKIFKEVNKTGIPQNFPLKIYDGDKIIVWIDHYISKLTNNQITAIFRDNSAEMKVLEALKESEQNLRAVLDASPDIIVLVDKNGNLIESNEKLEQALGVKRKEIISSDIFQNFDKDVKDIRTEVFKKVLKSKKRYTYKDVSNRKVWQNTIVPILDDKNLVSRLAVYTSDVTEKEKYESKLRERNESLRNLSKYITNIREEERKKIAREIHDNLSQILTAINMDVSWIKNLLPENLAEIKDRFMPLLKLIDNAILTVQKISTQLRPGILDDLGLVNAIEWQANEIRTKTHLNIKLELPENEIELSEEKRIALFRVFQESMSNVIRHANAKNLKIILKPNLNTLFLQIIDDGIGIPLEKINDNKSFGLLGMRERILAINGNIEFGNNPKAGTYVNISIPIKEQE